MKIKWISLVIVSILVLGALVFFRKTDNLVPAQVISDLTPINDNIETITSIWNASTTDIVSQNVINLDSHPLDFENIKVDTSDWLTYNDTHKGISFKYPKNVIVEDTTQYAGSVRFLLKVNPNDQNFDKNRDELWFSCCRNPSGIETILNQTIPYFESGKLSLQEFNVNENKVLIETVWDENRYFRNLAYIFLITDDDKIFEFTVNNIEGFSERNYDITVGILRTFKVNKLAI